MPAAAWVVPSVIGGLGLLQAGQAQRSQQGNINKALAAQAPQTAAEGQIYNLATGYNPAQEDKNAIAEANQNASQVLKQSLGQLRSQFAIDGGSPTGDTEFGVQATNTANRTLDPLRQFAAQLRSTETQRKAGMFNEVFNAPAGSISNAYFNAAQMNQPNYGPSLNLLTQAFQKLASTPAVGASGGAMYPGVTGGDSGMTGNFDGSGSEGF